MTKYHTMKRHAAIELLTSILGSPKGERIYSDRDSQELYDMLDNHNFIWDANVQRWRLRKPGTRRSKKTAKSTAKRVMLVRLMAPENILTGELETFKLAMEVAGYEIISMSGVQASRETSYYRVYLRLKVG